MVCTWLGCGSWVVRDKIAFKELFPIVVALELWDAQLANQRILFMSDNAAVLHAIKKQTCKEKTLMHLIRVSVSVIITLI